MVEHPYGRYSDRIDVAHPYTAVCPTLDGDVLRVLAGTTRGLTGREVAALTGRRSHSGVLDVLHRLTEHGLVTRVELNRAYLFTLNREHVAAPAVELLANLRAELFDRIRGAIAEWQIDPTHASVFGSTARGDGGVDSDIDLLIVRPPAIPDDEPRWRAQVEDLRKQIGAWSGNETTIFEVPVSALARLRDEQRPIVEELRSDAIALFGEEINTLLETASQRDAA
jgi:predicted nucleotidyltransferase